MNLWTSIQQSGTSLGVCSEGKEAVVEAQLETLWKNYGNPNSYESCCQEVKRCRRLIDKMSTVNTH